MSEAEEELSAEAEEPKSSPIKGMLFTAASALVMGAAAAGAAFFLAPGKQECEAAPVAANGAPEKHVPPENVTFINLDPLIVTLGPDAKSRYLKISLSLETTKESEQTLYDLGPRIRDALNSYLRAVEEDDLTRPSGMPRLRAQMLRRLRLAAPNADISDILITDFVLN